MAVTGRSSPLRRRPPTKPPAPGVPVGVPGGEARQRLPLAKAEVPPARWTRQDPMPRRALRAPRPAQVGVRRAWRRRGRPPARAAVPANGRRVPASTRAPAAKTTAQAASVGAPPQPSSLAPTRRAGLESITPRRRPPPAPPSAGPTLLRGRRQRRHDATWGRRHPACDRATGRPAATARANPAWPAAQASWVSRRQTPAAAGSSSPTCGPAPLPRASSR
jgi:hypothetical protein